MHKKDTGIGVGALPENILQSKILTANDIDLLASVQELPFVDPAYYDERLKNIFQYYSCVLFVATQLHSSIIMNG